MIKKVFFRHPNISCLWKRWISSKMKIHVWFMITCEFRLVWCTRSYHRMKETMAFRFHQENSDQFFNGTLMIKTVSFVVLPIIDISTNKQRELLIPILLIATSTCSGLRCCSGSAKPVLTRARFNEVVPILPPPLSLLLEPEKIAKAPAAQNFRLKVIKSKASVCKSFAK